MQNRNYVWVYTTEFYSSMCGIIKNKIEFSMVSDSVEHARTAILEKLNEERYVKTSDVAKQREFIKTTQPISLIPKVIIRHLSSEREYDMPTALGLTTME